MEWAVAVSLAGIIRLVVSVAILAGFIWLIGHLIARLVGPPTESPPGREPTDRVDDNERDIL